MLMGFYIFEIAKENSNGHLNPLVPKPFSTSSSFFGPTNIID